MKRRSGLPLASLLVHLTVWVRQSCLKDLQFLCFAFEFFFIEWIWAGKFLKRPQWGRNWRLLNIPRTTSTTALNNHRRADSMKNLKRYERKKNFTNRDRDADFSLFNQISPRARCRALKFQNCTFNSNLDHTTRYTERWLHPDSENAMVMHLS